MIRRQLFTLTLYSFKVNVIYYFHTIINDMPSLIIPSVQSLGSKSTTLFLQKKKKKIHLSLRKQAWMDDIFLCSKFKHIKEANYLCNMYNNTIES